MKKDIEFIFDEEWDEQEKELRQILHEVHDPKLHKDVYILESLMRACALNFIKKHKKEENILGKEITKPKYYQKVLNLLSGTEVQPVPVPSTETSLQPIQEFKETPLYTQKIVISPEKQETVDFTESYKGKKNLITDRITKRVLASVIIEDKNYNLQEPLLDETDISIIEKIKKKRIANMKKGWKFIQKYGKKYNIKAGHDNSIKYYLVNDIFGLGKIEPLLHDNEIEHIKCEGTEKNLVVKIKNQELITNIKFSIEDLKNFIKVMSIKLNKKVTKKTPLIEGELRGFMFKLNTSENLNNPSFIAKKI